MDGKCSGKTFARPTAVRVGSTQLSLLAGIRSATLHSAFIIEELERFKCHSEIKEQSEAQKTVSIVMNHIGEVSQLLQEMTSFVGENQELPVFGPMPM